MRTRSLTGMLQNSAVNQMAPGVILVDKVIKFSQRILQIQIHISNRFLYNQSNSSPRLLAVNTNMCSLISSVIEQKINAVYFKMFCYKMLLKLSVSYCLS